MFERKRYQGLGRLSSACVRVLLAAGADVNAEMPVRRMENGHYVDGTSRVMDCVFSGPEKPEIRTLIHDAEYEAALRHQFSR